MSKITQTIQAVYLEYSTFFAALKQLATIKDLDLEVLSPIPLHDVEKLLPQKPSGVRWFTFLGGIFGVSVGLGLPIYTVKWWPIITGGKPLITWPAFIIVAFELLILFGAIFTLLGLLFHARLPRQSLRHYDERFTETAFGFVIQAEEAQTEELKQILKESDDLKIIE